jgi:hypothetical protein
MALTMTEVERARNPPLRVADPTPDAPQADARVVPMKPTGFTTTGPQDHPQSGEPATPEVDEPPTSDAPRALAVHLASLWAELHRQGAVVNRIPLDAHPDVLTAHIEHEARRIRALRERP